MKREQEKSRNVVRKTGFSEKEFMEYLEERFRKLKLEEQKFREDVLSGSFNIKRNTDYVKLPG